MSMYKLTIRDEREGWLPYYGRQLAQAVREEKEAEEAYRKAMEKRNKIEEKIVSLGMRINEHLGMPEENKTCLDGELERVPTEKARSNRSWSSKPRP